ncbi:hypothetical protein R3P38DRAFT_2946625 [Favolaschia claudopus]|uniref:Secreted protein n=1 Tax=Favolaschia claudopus TaxID=2862362 RepID=A0AAW0BIL3_9AGAR
MLAKRLRLVLVSFVWAVCDLPCFLDPPFHDCRNDWEERSSWATIRTRRRAVVPCGSFTCLRGPGITRQAPSTCHRQPAEASLKLGVLQARPRKAAHLHFFLIRGNRFKNKRLVSYWLESRQLLWVGTYTGRATNTHSREYGDPKQCAFSQVGEKLETVLRRRWMTGQSDGMQQTLNEHVGEGHY